MVSLIAIRAGIVAAVLAALMGAGWYVKGAIEERKDLKETVAAQQEQLRLATKYQQVTTKVITKRVQSAAVIQERTQYVQVEVEKRIPVAGACVLPPDWRLLHDAAATNEPLPTGPAGADVSAVTAREAAKTVTRNYSRCLDNADKLEALQQWIKELTQKEPNGEPKQKIVDQQRRIEIPR